MLRVPIVTARHPVAFPAVHRVQEGGSFLASLAFSGFEDGLRDREVDDVSGGVSTTASLGGRSGTFESGFG
jgi:hypothetical protein